MQVNPLLISLAGRICKIEDRERTGMDEMEPMFTQLQLEAIASALGHTEEGLTGPEIGMLLPLARMIGSTRTDAL